MARTLYVALLMCAACQGPPSAPSIPEGPAIAPVPPVPSHSAIHRKPRVEVDQSIDEIEAMLRRLDEGLSKAR
jgi:hypothetical protein